MKLQNLGTDYHPSIPGRRGLPLRLAQDAARRRRYARDDASPDAEEMLQSIRDWLLGAYDRDDPDAASRLLDGMDELCGDPGHAGGEDRRIRRMGRDAELEFPSKPPGEAELRSAMDRRMAADARNNKSFADRHPGAASITPSAPIPTRTARGRTTSVTDFARRHPAAASIAIGDIR